MEFTTIGLCVLFFVLGRLSKKTNVTYDSQGGLKIFAFNVEQKDGQVFAYDWQNNFLAQSTNVEDVTMRVKDRVPGFTYYIALGSEPTK